MEFYCESCETAMCAECTDGEHREHVTVPLRDVVEQHKGALETQLDAIRGRLPQLTAAMELVSEISRQLSERRKAAEAEIGAAFLELERALEHRKTALLADLDNICGAKQKVLQAQLADLLQGRDRIQSSCGFTRQALDHGSAAEVLLVQKQMSERMTALARHDFPERPHQNAHLDCQVETEGLRRSIQNLGVLLTTSAVAHTSVATGEGLRHAAAGQHHTITVTTKDKDGELVRTGNALLKAELTAAADGIRAAAQAQVTDNKNGTYEVGFTLRGEGEYSLALSLYGQPVRASPFRLRAVKPRHAQPSPDHAKRRVKSPGAAKHVRQKALRRPSSMHSAAKKKENPIEDELIYRIGSRGRERGEFTNLQGISASASGRVVVADSNNQCIQIFSNDGQFKMRFGVRGRSPGQLQRPTGVAVDSNGDVVVADYDNRWVSIFSPDGKFKMCNFKRRYCVCYKRPPGGAPSLLARGPLGMSRPHCLLLRRRRTRSARAVCWVRRAWPWTRTDTSSRRTTRPAASSSSRPTESWSPSSEGAASPTDNLQVLTSWPSTTRTKSSSPTSTTTRSRCTAPTASSSSSSALTAKATDNSTRPPASPWTPTATSSSPTGATAGYRFSTARAPSCRTSTRRPTRFTARKVWR
ncbi:tripartite motif-containing protein 3-like isoform X6 [Vanacampus margaritifer]